MTKKDKLICDINSIDRGTCCLIICSVLFLIAGIYMNSAYLLIFGVILTFSAHLFNHKYNHLSSKLKVMK